MRVVIAWCHGGHWGHVSRQLALAAHLERLGASVVWAAPASRAAALEPVRQRGYRVLASRAVEPLPVNASQGKPRSFADILLRTGFDDPAVLEAHVGAWLKLYDHVQADRVLIDYAPVAQLAARLAGLPAVQISNGFDAPPVECPPYESTMRGPWLEQQAAAHKAHVERTIAEVAERLAPGQAVDLRSVLEHPRRLLDCVPETDPYAEQRSSEDRIDYVGPLGEAPSATAPSWPGAQSAIRVFAYLRGPASANLAVIDALRRRAAAVLCVWPDAPDAAVEGQTAGGSVRIVRDPVSTAQALRDARAVVNYGSSTFVCQTLLAGKPQLMLPLDEEKRLVARRVEQSALGLMLEHGASRAGVTLAVDALLDDAALRGRVLAVASRHAGLAEHSRLAVERAFGGGGQAVAQPAPAEPRRAPLLQLRPSQGPRILVLHQNFPGQFGHMVSDWSRRPGWDVRALGHDTAPGLPGFTGLTRYRPTRRARDDQHPYLRSMEAAVLNGQQVARELLKMKQQGFTPDAVLAHPGWGESLYVKDVFPDARLVHYCEWYYSAEGADIGFDPEFPPTLDDRMRVRTWNALHGLNLENCDAGVSPTHWQKSRHPEAYRPKITVQHEGIDTEGLGPDPTATVTTPSGVTLKAGDPVVTYVARNLEPYRGFHIFMRALEKLQQRHKTVHALIVGGDDVSYGKAPKGAGNWREKMLGEVKLDPTRTHFMGRIPRERYIKVLQVSAAHVYLTYPFVLSWSLLEAMACGAPIVASDTAPVREVVEHGRNVQLGDFFDADAVAGCLANEVARIGRQAPFAKAGLIAAEAFSWARGNEAYERMLLAKRMPSSEAPLRAKADLNSAVEVVEVIA
jgi:glycosyltransferase involved in cell wall biosynthesis/UDP:flavonoid glycosyltransferase YjiC (YdhE family)